MRAARPLVAASMSERMPPAIDPLAHARRHIRFADVLVLVLVPEIEAGTKTGTKLSNVRHPMKFTAFHLDFFDMAIC